MNGIGREAVFCSRALLRHALHPVRKTDRLGLLLALGGQLRVQDEATRIADPKNLRQTGERVSIFPTIRRFHPQENWPFRNLDRVTPLSKANYFRITRRRNEWPTKQTTSNRSRTGSVKSSCIKGQQDATRDEKSRHKIPHSNSRRETKENPWNRY